MSITRFRRRARRVFLLLSDSSLGSINTLQPSSNQTSGAAPELIGTPLRLMASARRLSRSGWRLASNPDRVADRIIDRCMDVTGVNRITDAKQIEAGLRIGVRKHLATVNQIVVDDRSPVA